MLRRAMSEAGVGMGGNGGGDPTAFRHRGKDVSRLEGLADGVFALAMTLIIVSVEVPGSYQELISVVRGFPAFAVCFALLMWFWFLHYRFFRRYGLSDPLTVVLNAALLFIVLFYVYPMKFVFGQFVKMLTGMGSGPAHAHMLASEIANLFMLYSVGFAMVFGVFVAMHANALRHADRLELTDLERLDTRWEMRYSTVPIVIAAISVLFAAFAQGLWISAAGWIYGAIGPGMWFVGSRHARARTQLLSRM